MAQNKPKFNRRREMGEIIDLQGLTQEEVKQVRELVESLKKRKKIELKKEVELRSWDLGEIKGSLSREEIYDWL